MKVKCDCECHEPGVVMLHAIPCCHDGGVEKSPPLFFSGHLKNDDGSLGEAVSGQIGNTHAPAIAFELAEELPALDLPKSLLDGGTITASMSVDLDTPGAKKFLDWFKYDPMVVTFGRVSHTVDDGSDPPPDVAFLVMPAEFIGKKYRLVPL
jgi:hypothetical protein